MIGEYGNRLGLELVDFPVLNEKSTNHNLFYFVSFINNPETALCCDQVRLLQAVEPPPIVCKF